VHTKVVGSTTCHHETRQNANCELEFIGEDKDRQLASLLKATKIGEIMPREAIGSSSLVAHVLPYPPPPHVNIFVLGPAVINTHTIEEEARPGRRTGAKSGQ
jgi:hypothetical protein